MLPKPYNNRILIQLIPPADTSILLPETVTDWTAWWTVLDVADGIDIPIGSEVLLVPGCNILGLDDAKRIGFTANTSVVAMRKGTKVE